MTGKRLVVNADDFGFTKDVNDGIVEAHRTGILTATTLMANGEAFDDAVRLAKVTPSLDVGCHLVLVQGRSVATGLPLPESPKQLVPMVLRNQLDLRAELRAQVLKIKAAGLSPTHVDTHKHTHLLPQVFRAVVEVAQEFSIPYVRLSFDRERLGVNLPIGALAAIARRAARKRGLFATDWFVGFWLTGRLAEESLIEALGHMRNGSTELMCHPGYLGTELSSAATRLKETRVRELEALVSPKVRRTVDSEGLELCNYRDLFRLESQSKPTY